MQAVRYSRQREAIKNYLMSATSHPTAEMVYSNVKERFPNISLGTVYRNLNQLAEAGVISKLQFGSLGIDHFDYDTSPHQHFVCTKCDSVIDLPMGDVSYIDAEASKHFDGLIQGHKLYFCGLCKKCLTKQDNKQ